MKKIVLIATIIIATVSCNRINPFLTEWDTPYGIPDFNQIEEKHSVLFNVSETEDSWWK